MWLVQILLKRDLPPTIPLTFMITEQAAGLEVNKLHRLISAGLQTS